MYRSATGKSSIARAGLGLGQGASSLPCAVPSGPCCGSGAHDGEIPPAGRAAPAFEEAPLQIEGPT